MTSDFTIQIKEDLPLRDVVFQTLRQAILKGELRPGERLMEIALANRLGVSRTPIREAMRRLELEGLVVMIPRRGAHVASITEKDLNDVLELRIALENTAIEKACRRMTSAQLDELQEASLRFEQSIEEGDLVHQAEADEVFHEMIYQAADNARLLQVLHNLKEQMYRYRMEYLKEADARTQLKTEHRELLDAVQNRDILRAQEISYQHLENQRKAIVASIRKEAEQEKKEDRRWKKRS